MNDNIIEKPGSSKEQIEAEEYLIKSLADKLCIKLRKKKFMLPNKGWLEIDGFSDNPPILCETWAHIGAPKPAQKFKVISDASKMIFANEYLLSNTGKCILLFCDNCASSHFQGSSWMAQYIKHKKIEIDIIPLSADLKKKVSDAQKRQYR